MIKYAYIILGLALATNSIAGEEFTVKITNKSIENLDGVYSRVYAKGNRVSICIGPYMNEINIGEAESYRCSPTVTKWKRKVKLTFKCDGVERVIYFPRGKKWYDRDHTVKNDNLYNIKLKQSDC